MRRRPLPFVQHLNTLPPEEQISQKNQAMEALIRTPGVQLFFEVLEDVEAQIVGTLRRGADNPERCAGGLEAVARIRALIADLYPKQEAPPPEAEEEFEIPYLYESSFDIPLPSGEAPVSDFS